MKLKNHLVTLLVSALFSTSAYAYDEQVSGDIKLIRTVKYKENDLLWSNASWIGIEGLSAAGSCATEQGYVRLKIEEQSKHLYSMVLAAAASSKSIRVRVSDAPENKDSQGNCIIWYADLVY